MLVDDHAIVRAGYRQLLSNTPNISVIGESNTAEDAYRQYIDLQPDIVMMDLNLPGMSGMKAIRCITAYDPDAAILVFTMHDEVTYVQSAMNTGAKGYLTKSCEPDLLIKGVNALAKGDIYIEPALDIKLQQLMTNTRPVEKRGLDTLTPREFDVFCQLAEGKACKQIAHALHLSEKTISNYATLIKKKLGVRTLSELTRIAYREGIASV